MLTEALPGHSLLNALVLSSGLCVMTLIRDIDMLSAFEYNNQPLIRGYPRIIYAD